MQLNQSLVISSRKLGQKNYSWKTLKNNRKRDGNLTSLTCDEHPSENTRSLIRGIYIVSWALNEGCVSPIDLAQRLDIIKEKDEGKSHRWGEQQLSLAVLYCPLLFVFFFYYLILRTITVFNLPDHFWLTLILLSYPYIYIRIHC